MLLEIYLFIFSSGILLMLLSFIKKDNIIFPWLTASLFFMIGILSYSIEVPFCAFQAEWNCYTYTYMSEGLAYLGYGLGIINLIFAIYTSVVTVGKGAEQGVTE